MTAMIVVNTITPMRHLSIIIDVASLHRPPSASERGNDAIPSAWPYRYESLDDQLRGMGHRQGLGRGQRRRVYRGDKPINRSGRQLYRYRRRVRRWSQ